MIDYPRLFAEILAAHRALVQYGDTELDRQFKPATEEDVAAAEARLGCRLPPSYRQFLLSVNGCPKLGLAHGGLLPVQSIDWFRNRHQDWIDAYTKPITNHLPADVTDELRIFSPELFDADVHDITEEEHLAHPDNTCRFRIAYLHELLQIGEVFDGSVYLLNPKVTTESEEWEAWSFANWYPGAHRVLSFADLIMSEHEHLLYEVHLRSVEVDESQIMKKSLPVLREQIVAGMLPAHAVIQYLESAAENDETFAAWMRKKQPYFALLEALGYHRGD